MDLHNRDNEIRDAVLMLSFPEPIDCMQKIYNRTSVARTLMASSPQRFQNRS